MGSAKKRASGGMAGDLIGEGSLSVEFDLPPHLTVSGTVSGSFCDLLVRGVLAAVSATETIADRRDGSVGLEGSKVVETVVFAGNNDGVVVASVVEIGDCLTSGVVLLTVWKIESVFCLC